MAWEKYEGYTPEQLMGVPDTKKVIHILAARYHGKGGPHADSGRAALESVAWVAAWEAALLYKVDEKSKPWGLYLWAGIQFSFWNYLKKETRAYHAGKKLLSFESPDEDDGDLLLLVADPGESHTEATDTRLDSAELVASLYRELRPAERQLLEEHYANGESYTVLAKRYGISREGVRWRVKGIRSRLAQAGFAVKECD